MTSAGRLAAQDPDGTTVGAVGAGVLGAYSGGMLGLLGALVPCGQTLAGPTCSAWVAGVGGALGAVGGATLGAADSDAFRRRATAGLLGAAVGGVAGYALKGIVRQYGWLDVASGTAIGLAVGASAPEALIGLGSGALAGGLLLATVPSIRVSDAVTVSLAGLALGGVIGWVAEGAQARNRGNGAAVALSFSPPR